MDVLTADSKLTRSAQLGEISLSEKPEAQIAQGLMRLG